VEGASEMILGSGMLEEKECAAQKRNDAKTKLVIKSRFFIFP